MRSAESLRTEIQAECGHLPAFLGIGESVNLLEGLWRQTQCSYLHNPLPTPLKEQLLAYLSRYCASSCCMIVHACELRRLGWTGRQVLDLLKSAPPTPVEMAHHIRVLEQASAEGRVLTSPKVQRAVFWLAVDLFLHRERHRLSQEELRERLGTEAYEALIALLAFVRTLHQWCEAHPEVSAEQDARAAGLERLLAEEPGLAGFFKAYPRHVLHEQSSRERQLATELSRQDWARRALEASEMQHRLAVLHAPFPVMIYAEDLQVVEINDVWTELSGYSHRDIPTLGAWIERAQPEQVAPSRDEIDALYSSRQRVEEGAQTIRTRCGGELMWDFTSAPLGRLPDGRRAVIRMAADVTERRQLEAALWETNRRMQNILESIADGFVSLDRDWRFIYVNRRAVEFLGRQREQLIGRCIFELFPQAETMGFRDTAAPAMEQGRTVSNEVRMPPAGRLFAYHIYPSNEGLSVYFQETTGRAG